MKIPKHIIELLAGGRKIGGATVTRVGGPLAKGATKFGIGYAAFEGVSKLLTQANDNATNDNEDKRRPIANDDAPEKVRGPVVNSNLANKVAPFRVNKSMNNNLPGVNDNNLSASSLNKPIIKTPSNLNNISSDTFKRKIDLKSVNDNNMSAASLINYTDAIPSGANDNPAAKIAPRKKRRTEKEIVDDVKRKNNVHFLASIVPYLKNKIEINAQNIKTISDSLVNLEKRLEVVTVLEQTNQKNIANVVETVRVEKVLEDKRYESIVKVVQGLRAKINQVEKEALERKQAEEYVRKEDVIEGKGDKEKGSIGGAFRSAVKNKLLTNAIGPLGLAMLMGMGALKEMATGLQEQFEGLEANYGEMALKLAAAGIPGFMIGKYINDKIKAPKPTAPIVPKEAPKAPSSSVPKTADQSTKSKAKDTISRIFDLEEKLKNAPSWVKKVLGGVRKLATKATSKLPVIGAVVTIALELLESYDPRIHTNPQEFQKLLISSILVGAADTLIFTALITVFFLIGGPLGAVAAIVLYTVASDTIIDAIRAELVGYLVKYVFFDEDPVEAAKKTGRDIEYEKAKNKAEKQIADAEANMKTIQAKEDRGEKLSQVEIDMKKGYQSQIDGGKKFIKKIETAQNKALDIAKEEKVRLEEGKAAIEKEKREGKTGSGQSQPEMVGLDALKQEIAKGEGDYGAFNKGRAGDSINSKEFDLQNMTVAEVMAAQKKGLFAVGKYQFIPNTLKEAVDYTKIDPSEKFNAETQEKLFSYLISDKKRPNLAAYLSGKSNDENAALNDLAYEFASIPDASGRGKYDGDSAGNRAAGGLQRAKKVLGIMKETRDVNVAQAKENKIRSQIPKPEVMEAQVPPELKAPTPVPQVPEVDIPEPQVQQAQSVTVIAAPPQQEAKAPPPNVEQSARPGPANIPSAIAATRPNMNMDYSPF